MSIEEYLNRIIDKPMIFTYNIPGLDCNFINKIIRRDYENLGISLGNIDILTILEGFRDKAVYKGEKFKDILIDLIKNFANNEEVEVNIKEFFIEFLDNIEFEDLDGTLLSIEIYHSPTVVGEGRSKGTVFYEYTIKDSKRGEIREIRRRALEGLLPSPTFYILHAFPEKNRGILRLKSGILEVIPCEELVVVSSKVLGITARSSYYIKVRDPEFYKDVRILSIFEKEQSSGYLKVHYIKSQDLDIVYKFYKVGYGYIRVYKGTKFRSLW